MSPLTASGAPPRRCGSPVLALAAAAALLAACRVAEPGPISRQKFVDVYVQLVQARIDAAGDSVAYAAKRKRVFLDAGLDPEDMQAFLETSREDPTRIRDAWREIAARLDTIYGGVTSRPPAALREALRARMDTTVVAPADSPSPPSRAGRAAREDVVPPDAVPGGARQEVLPPAPTRGDVREPASPAPPDSLARSEAPPAGRPAPRER